MPFDTLVAAAMARELGQTLVGMRVVRAHQPDPHTLLLQLRGPQEEACLLLSTHPQLSRVHRTLPCTRGASPPSAFLSLVRRRLEGSRLVDVSLPPGDRTFFLDFLGRDELGDPCTYRLAAEIMGARSNLVLLGPDGRILDALRRCSLAENERREVLPGRPYQPPPPPPGISALGDEAALAEVLAAPSQQPAADTLRRRVGGLGPWVAREVCARAGLSPEGPWPADPSGLLRALAAMRPLLRGEGPYTPVVLLDEDGRPRDAWATIPAHLPGARLREAPDLSRALEEVYREKHAHAALAGRRSALERVAQQALRRLEQKMAKQQAELQEALDADRLRRWGEILYANLFRLPPRPPAEVELPDFEGNLVRIPLDPALSAPANAQRLFARYRKLERARQRLTEELERGGQEQAYLEGVLTALAQAEKEEDLLLVEEELAQAGYLPRPRSRPAPAPSGGPLRYRTEDGHEILVGRSMAENDRLTFRLARPDDMWLHVKDLPGSHCILRLAPGEEPSSSLLLTAAAVAAYHSRARGGSRVPVDYTRRRHVRKLPGSPPGYVLYDHHRTVYVTPSPELLPPRASP